MKQFGVSVYPDIHSLDEIKAYLKLAGSYGAKYVFSSMFSVEGTNEEVLALFREMIACAHEEGMEVVLDLNPVFLTRLGVTEEDVSILAGIGCDVMRMDVPYGAERDLKLVSNPYGIKIMFNASGAILPELAYFEEHGIAKDRVLLGHNFYPQPYTGLKWKMFLETNAAIAKYGYPIQAFVSSHDENATGVWDAEYGLPTVEKTRNMPIDLAARVLLATGNLDMVWIGNAFASKEEFELLQEAFSEPRKIEESPLVEAMKGYGMTLRPIEDELKLRVILEEGIGEQERFQVEKLYPQADAGDSSEWIWRSRAGRFLHPSIPPRTCEKEMFERGDVVMVNDNYRHYAGEIAIVKIPFANDGIRNLIGHLAEGEEELLDLIRDGQYIRFLTK